jgi:hypothetical protein
VTYSGADIVSGAPATTTYGSSVKMAWDGIIYGNNGNTMNFTLGCGSPETNLVTVQGGDPTKQQDLSGLIPAACQGQSLHLVGRCPFE